MDMKILGFITDAVFSFVFFSLFIWITFGFVYYGENFISLLFAFLIGTIIYDLIFKPSDYRFNVLWYKLKTKFNNQKN